ncbi:transposable element gene [Prunus dulcis]|uniref:Transposable element protein n=1 Tax=Prunus dulcis TaxID=3755 RepID=A0A4Y1QK78_PRUDU|nr:transposable element gene [Prunus dulcis]
MIILPLLLLYVDDMLIACQDKSRIQDLNMLHEEFGMKDLGAAQKILGLEIQRDRTAGRIWISQAKYIQKVLEKFNMQEAKVVSTPLAAHFNLSGQQCPKSKEEQQVMEKVPYANAVGCLMYAMVCTLLDIAQAITVVSRYMANPGTQHWNAVKWIFGFLATKDYV